MGPRDSADNLRGDIEGLRAVAVTSVLLFHAGVPSFGGGFSGVDVFFVISGFLITSQLVRTAEATGRVSLVEFYSRRMKRLLPAAGVVLVACLLAAWLCWPASDWRLVGSDVAASALYIVNWSLALRAVDYLAEDATPNLVQHYWSLSVEEQFYVFWPLLIMGVLWFVRRRHLPLRRWLMVTLTTVIIASMVHSVIFTSSNPGQAYFFSTTRVWELALGAVTAVLAPSFTRLGRGAVLALVGIAAVVASAFVFSSATPWPGSAALLPTLGTALVITGGCAELGNPVARILGTRILRFIGGLSYGIYLWHWPIVLLLERQAPDAWWKWGVVFSGSTCLAWLTARFVENPIRFHRGLARHAGLTVFLGLVTMAVTVAAALGLRALVPTSDSFLADGPHRGALALVDPTSTTNPPRRISDPSSAYRVTANLLPAPAVATEDLPDVYANKCHVPEKTTTVVGPDECLYGDEQGKVTAVLVGDSKASQWTPALDAIGKVEGWRIQVLAKSNCAFTTDAEVTPECRAYNRALLQRLETEPPSVVITSTDTNRSAGVVAQFDTLMPLVDRLLVLDDNPGSKHGPVYECVQEEGIDACSYPREPASGHATLAALARAQHTPLVSMSEWICPTAICPPAIGNVLVLRQSSHLTNTYLRTLAPLLHRELIVQGLASGTPLPMRPIE